MRFRRNNETTEEKLCCPQCKELLPEGTLQCDMCGYNAKSELEARCEPESVAERGFVDSEVPSRR